MAEDNDEEDVVEKAVTTEEAEGMAEAEAVAAMGMGRGLEDEDLGLSSDDLWAAV